MRCGKGRRTEGFLRERTCVVGRGERRLGAKMKLEPYGLRSAVVTEGIQVCVYSSNTSSHGSLSSIQTSRRAHGRNSDG